MALAVDNPGQLWRTHAALARLREAQRQPKETRAALDRAAFVKKLTERVEDA